MYIVDSQNLTISHSEKIGKTTYIIRIGQAQDAKLTLKQLIERIIKNKCLELK